VKVQRAKSSPAHAIVNSAGLPRLWLEMKHYIALTKPRITALILVCTGVGYCFGAVNGWRVWAFVHTLLGTALMASGTAALNQWYERDVDYKMRRTRGRPLPSGQIEPAHALIFGLGVSFAGFLELWMGANALAGLAGLFTLASYLLAYTPLKKRSPICTAVGAIPGAMPPVIGYAAARGHVTWEALALFAILFVWQFPHFYAIAWMYREDYARGGIRMLPVVRPDGASTARQIVICSLLLIPVSLIPSYLHMTGAIYFAGAAFLGVDFLYFGLQVSCERTTQSARHVLLASVIYLPALLSLMVYDRIGSR
jgi:heme o synthase